MFSRRATLSLSSFYLPCKIVSATTIAFEKNNVAETSLPATAVAGRFPMRYYVAERQ
jgi:hypothetical protein